MITMGIVIVVTICVCTFVTELNISQVNRQIDKTNTILKEIRDKR